METSINTATFTCEKYHCTLTRRACAERRVALIERAGYRRLPTYPGCQECEQGRSIAVGIDTSNIAPRPWGRAVNKIKQEGNNMGHQKIDVDKLRRLVAEGKHINIIAAEFGVHHTAVRRHMKILGLTPNHRRKLKDAAAPVAAPVRQTAANRPDLTYKGDQEEAARIIPVTLRLTVEVNVRVCAGAV